MACLEQGGWAERIPPHRVAALPDDVSFEQATPLAAAGITALPHCGWATRSWAATSGRRRDQRRRPGRRAARGPAPLRRPCGDRKPGSHQYGYGDG